MVHDLIRGYKCGLVIRIPLTLNTLLHSCHTRHDHATWSELCGRNVAVSRHAFVSVETDKIPCSTSENIMLTNAVREPPARAAQRLHNKSRLENIALCVIQIVMGP